MLSATSTFFHLQLKRHFSNPMLWIVLLVAPIAAKYMIPLQSESYSVMSINNAYLELSSSVIGLQLGVISALLLSPLAYIYLRTSRINQTPWQVEDVTPTKRIALHLGHWAADTCVVWLFLLTLAISGIILSFFRLPLENISVAETVFCCLAVSCSAFAFIAAMRLFFASRPWLRGATGDVLFFFIWTAGISIGAFAADGGISGLWDLFGFAQPVALSIDEPFDSLSIGAGPASSGGAITIDALKGVTDVSYIISRFVWLGFGVVLVLLSSLVYKTKITKPKRERKIVVKVRQLLSKFNHINPLIVPAILPTLVRSNILLVLRQEGLVILLLGIAFAGLRYPYESVIGPALWLVTLFPFTHHVGQWSQRNLQPFLQTLPSSRSKTLWSNIVALSSILLVLSVPSLVKVVSTQDYAALDDIMLVSLIVPTVTVILCYVFKSSFAVRLPMLIAWYAYFNAQ